jgi:hypothetical protein
MSFIYLLTVYLATPSVNPACGAAQAFAEETEENHKNPELG